MNQETPLKKADRLAKEAHSEMIVAGEYPQHKIIPVETVICPPDSTMEKQRVWYDKKETRWVRETTYRDGELSYAYAATKDGFHPQDREAARRKMAEKITAVLDAEEKEAFNQQLHVKAIEYWKHSPHGQEYLRDFECPAATDMLMDRWIAKFDKQLCGNDDWDFPRLVNILEEVYCQLLDHGDFDKFAKQNQPEEASPDVPEAKAYSQTELEQMRRLLVRRYGQQRTITKEMALRARLTEDQWNALSVYLSNSKVDVLPEEERTPYSGHRDTPEVQSRRAQDAENKKLKFSDLKKAYLADLFGGKR